MAGAEGQIVDTGRAKFILREFPLDPLATAAFMAARCAGADKRDALIDRLFARQEEWAFRDEPLERLRRETGLSPADFLACVKDKALFDGINAERDFAAERFGLDRRRRSSSTATSSTANWRCQPSTRRWRRR